MDKTFKNVAGKRDFRKNADENIIEFGITNFEKSSSGVNKANEIITNIYTDLLEKYMEKNTIMKKKEKA